MILADKIIRLRKKNGWSQEELAEKMDVSRQAVSKWEAAQTTPDLGKVLQLSKLFGVTTDYLLKDEMEDEELADSTDETMLRRISLAEANEYLELRKEASIKIAVATLLCIVSSLPLLLLIALSELTSLPIASNTAIGIGVVAIFPIIAIAVYMFIRTGFKSASYEFLENEPFEAEYGVTGLVKDRKKAYRSTYVKYNYIGACSCILSPVPLLCGAFSGSSLLTMLMLCLTMLIVGVGVMFFIVAGVRWASMNKLEEGEFSSKRKRGNKLKETISTVYWLIAVAIYLLWSFLFDAWKISWVVWPIAGILSVVVELVSGLLIDKEDD